MYLQHHSSENISFIIHHQSIFAGKNIQNILSSTLMCKNCVVLNKHLKPILYSTKMGSSTTYNSSKPYVSSQTIFCASYSTIL